MAELSFSYPVPSSSTTTVTKTVGIARRILIRIGEKIPANTAININNPGSGWHKEGTEVTFSGSNDFVEHSQVYRNGQILLTGLDAATNNDVHFVAASGILAFDSPIRTNDIIQVWDYTTNASGTS